MAELVKNLSSKQPHYIRCIKVSPLLAQVVNYSCNLVTGYLHCKEKDQSKDDLIISISFSVSMQAKSDSWSRNKVPRALLTPVSGCPLSVNPPVHSYLA